MYSTVGTTSDVCKALFTLLMLKKQLRSPLQLHLQKSQGTMLLNGTIIQNVRTVYES